MASSHSGDQIYADGPIQAEVKLADGTLWKNITTPEKSKVAETLAVYRGNFAYNLLDDHKRRFCAEVPFLVQWDDHETRNNWYPEQILNGDNSIPSGRELELASLVSFIKNNAIKNVVCVTADVHYAQATYYSPSQAEFEDFLPFWEFVAGPINAGTFGPNELDLTFGPEIRYQSVTAGLKQNLPPTHGKQYFGAVRIDGATEAMTVTLHDVKGDTLFRVSLDPEA